MTNGCCIIETRLIGNLQEIIQQKHLNFIPREWGLTLFLSEANKHLAQPHMFDREVQVFILPDYFPEHEYNKLLTSVSFWEKLPYEKVLIFQTDSELLKEGIEDWAKMGYYFIGSPDPRSTNEIMMNGGLSLRNVQWCKQICTLFPFFNEVNEDWWFCSHLAGELLPTYDIAKTFSVETKFYYESLGAHAIDRYLSVEECKLIREQYKWATT